MKAPKILALLVYLVAPTYGQELQAMIDMPQPKPEAVRGWQGHSKASAEHRFWDRTNKIETASMVGLTAFDMGQTCHNLASTRTVITHLTKAGAPNGYVNVPITLHGHEHGLPTQSCAGAVGLSSAFDGAAAGLSYLFYRTHHHKLERIPVLYMSGASLEGIIYSKEHGAW
jgi:hypothetical protein